jgi:hypothetical protein
MQGWLALHFRKLLSHMKGTLDKVEVPKVGCASEWWSKREISTLL